MDWENVTDLIFDLPEKLAGLGNALYNLITTGITIGDTTYSIWLLFGGVGLVALLIFIIIRGAIG